ncbi:MAG: lysylphosphatidylglycerol synthase transmembrane domain-containing protein [Patescibacteria group bacterium]
MKKTLLLILSIVVGIVLFIGVLIYIGPEELAVAFESFSWGMIAIIVALGFLQIFIAIYRWQVVLAAHGDRIPFRKLISPKFVGFTVSFLTPGMYIGGEPVRAYLLKKKTGLRYSRGLASIMIDKILDFTYPLPFLIGALIYAMLTYDISWEGVSVFVAVLVVLIGLLGMFYVQTYRGQGFFSSLIKLFQLHRFNKIKKLIEKMLYFEKLIITFFNNRRIVVVQGLLLSLLGGVVTFIQFMVILHSLGIEADIVEILVMMVFMILSFFMPIPASLGSFEASQVIVFTALGYPASIGVAFTLILRVAELAKLSIGLTLLSNLGLKFLKELPSKNGDRSD